VKSATLKTILRKTLVVRSAKRSDDDTRKFKHSNDSRRWCVVGEA
jgi:hypothetical protein